MNIRKSRYRLGLITALAFSCSSGLGAVTFEGLKRVEQGQEAVYEEATQALVQEMPRICFCCDLYRARYLDLLNALVEKDRVLAEAAVAVEEVMRSPHELDIYNSQAEYLLRKLEVRTATETQDV